jgi:hypothetical protein
MQVHKCVIISVSCNVVLGIMYEHKVKINEKFVHFVQSGFNLVDIVIKMFSFFSTHFGCMLTFQPFQLT